MAKKKDPKRSQKRKGKQNGGSGTNGTPNAKVSNGSSTTDAITSSHSKSDFDWKPWLFPIIGAIVAIVYLNLPTNHAPTPSTPGPNADTSSSNVNDEAAELLKDIVGEELSSTKLDQKKPKARRISAADFKKGNELHTKGMEYLQSNRIYEAVPLFEEAAELLYSEPEVFNSWAGALRFLGRREEALQVLARGEVNAIDRYGADEGRLAIIKQGQYHIYSDLKRDNEAEKAIEKACELNPTASNYNNWASMDHLDHKRKIELYSKALELDEDYYPAFCMRVHSYLFLPDWDNAAKDQEKLLQYQEEMLAKPFSRTDNSACLQPFHATYMNISSELLLRTSILYGLRQATVTDAEVLPRLDPAQIDPVYDSSGKRLRKLRIGYVSSDLNQHPVGRNVAGLLMAHNKKKYEVFTFNTLRNDNPITSLIEQHSTSVDVTRIGAHAELAKLIREEYKIDVLIDLNGWTEGRRLQSFGARPAPVQMTHGLGFVGTVGAEAFDYFISDAVASPHRFEHYYSENVVRLPQAYLPASHAKVTITAPQFNPDTVNKKQVGMQHGLPGDDRFVFCSFQGVNRISQEAFETWMRILQASPNSIFWMTRPNSDQQKNLEEKARSLGVDTSRFFWGGRLLPGENMERSQACDLMLDSWPYNAHSTGVDTLWSGVPMMVYLPDYHDEDAATQVPKMASRVSASLLHSVGMPQLVRSSIEDFENEAVRLSKDPVAYNAVRDELLEKRKDAKLFDLRSYAWAHEMAYENAFLLYMSGQDAQSFDVPARVPKAKAS